VQGEVDAWNGTSVRAIEQVPDRLRQHFGQRGDSGRVGKNTGSLDVVEALAHLVRVAGEGEQCRMRPIAGDELMPGAAAEAYGEETIRRNRDDTQRIDECRGIALDVGRTHGREPQFRAPAARYRREDARRGVPVERMPACAHREGIQRRCIAVGKMQGAQPGRRLIQRVNELRVEGLPLSCVGNQSVARADTELGDQGDFDGRSACCGRQADGRKGRNRACGGRHGLNSRASIGLGRGFRV